MSVEAITWALANSESTLAARLVLISLANHAHPDGGNAFPAVATLAKQARLSERTVQRSLRELEELGEIKRTGQTKSGITVYAVGGDNMSPDFLSKGYMTDRVTSATPKPQSMSPQADKLAPLTCPHGYCRLEFKTELSLIDHRRNVHEEDIALPEVEAA